MVMKINDQKLVTRKALNLIADIARDEQSVVLKPSASKLSIQSIVESDQSEDAINNSEKKN